MSNVPSSEKIKSLNKRFIPGNIAVAVIAFIATICTLVMPWINIQITVDNKKLVDVIELSNPDSDQPQMVASTTEGIDIAAIVLNVLNEQSIPTIPINIKPTKMLKAATGDTEDISAFIVSSVGADGAAEFAKKVINQITPEIVKETVNYALDNLVAEAIASEDINLTEAQQEQLENYKGQAGSIIETLMGDEKQASDPEKAKEQFSTLVEQIVDEQAGENVEINEDDMEELFDALVDAGTTEEGNFEATVLLQNIDSILDVINSIENGKDIEELLPVADSGEKAISFLSTEKKEVSPLAGSNENALPSEIQDILDFMNAPEATLTEILDDSGFDFAQIQPIILAVWFLFIGLPALGWFLLAVKAIIRIYTNKKGIRTIGAEIYGLSIGAFLIVLNVAVMPLAKIIGGSEVARILDAITIRFLGSGIAIAICGLLLLVLSIAYYRPIRKKIKYAMANSAPEAEAEEAVSEEAAYDSSSEF